MGEHEFWQMILCEFDDKQEFVITYDEIKALVDEYIALKSRFESAKEQDSCPF